MISKADIGKAVTIDLGSGSYKVSKTYSGHSADVTVTYPNEDYGKTTFIVWDVSENNLVLTTFSAVFGFTLRGNVGCNNANYLMNESCSACFTSKYFPGMSARALRLSDILISAGVVDKFNVGTSYMVTDRARSLPSRARATTKTRNCRH